MEEKRNDRRVERTRQALCNSLTELLAHKEIHAITVTELCKQANINRNTFYAHYSSPEALLHSMENIFYQQMNDLIGRSQLNLLEDLFGILYQNRALCTVLARDPDGRFNKRLKESARVIMLQEWKKENIADDEIPNEELFLFLYGGSWAILKLWIQEGMHTPSHEIARHIANISARITKSPQIGG